MIYFLIPTYNEAQNIPNLFEELNRVLPQEEKFYVFSDDGSSDDTINLIQTHFSKTSHAILGDGINRGPGYVFNVGFEWILNHSQHETDRIITMEADCTSDISILPNMLSISRLNYDLVLASVYAQGGGFDKTSWLRKLVSAAANLVFRTCLVLKC
jgi:dolichol-phosphate mannosyltransferase